MTTPKISDLDPQYYSAALQAQLIYVNIKQEIEKIINDNTYNSTDFKKIFDDIQSFMNITLNTNVIPAMPNIDETNFFDVVYNDMIDIYNQLRDAITYFSEDQWNTMLALINEKKAEIEQSILNKLKLSGYGRRITLTSSAPLQNIQSQGLLAKDLFLSCEELPNEVNYAYLRIKTENKFPSTYAITVGKEKFIIKNGMRPFCYGNFKYSVDEFGGLQVQPGYSIDMLNNYSLDFLLNNLIFKNVGIDFSEYDDATKYISNPTFEKALVLKANRCYFLCCTDNANQLQIPIPREEINNLANASYIYPPTKLQVNYATVNDNGVIKNYGADGRIITQENNKQQSSSTVWNRTGRTVPRSDRMLRMANIELGCNTKVLDDGKDYTRMKPFWKAYLGVMKQQAQECEITLPPLTIYPVLYEDTAVYDRLEGGSYDPYNCEGYVGEYCEVRGGYECDSSKNPCYLPYKYLSLEQEKILLDIQEEKMKNNYKNLEYQQIEIIGAQPGETYLLWGAKI